MMDDAINIFITVDKQKLYCNDTRNITAGTHKFVLFNFLFSDEWATLAVSAHFIQNGNTYNIPLDSNNCVYLPQNIRDGICYIAIKGVKDDVVAVTQPLRLNILPNPIT